MSRASYIPRAFIDEVIVKDITVNNIMNSVGSARTVANIAAKVDIITDLLQIDTSKLETGEQFYVLGYHTRDDSGGGIFYWDADEDKANHNGGTIIDPTQPFPNDWSDISQQNDWFTASGSGNGCWKRVHDNNIDVGWFGAKNDPAVDSGNIIKHICNTFTENITLIINDIFYIISDVTIPENVNLKFFNGGILNVLTQDISNENVGTGDGSTTEFPLTYSSVLENSETIYVDGTEQTRNTDYTINYETGVITFTSALANGASITADYTRRFKLTINGGVDAGLFQIFNGDGVVTGNPKIEAVYPEWFGAKGDGITDDSNAFKKLDSFIRNCSKGLKIEIHQGYYITSHPLTIRNEGCIVEGVGNPIIRNDNDYTLVVGNNGSNSLIQDMLTGSNIAYIDDTSRYKVGQTVIVTSLSSINSSESNFIPLYKQEFLIIEVGANYLKFSTNAKYDFKVTDEAAITIDKLPTNCKIEGITFMNNSTKIPYLVSIGSGVNVEIKNCVFDSHTAWGYVSYAFNVLFDNCIFRAYGGISTARGTYSCTFRNCSFMPHCDNQQGIIGFFEESPRFLLFDNCDFYGGRIHFTNSADTTPPKRVIIRNSNIEVSDDRAIVISGFYNTKGYAVSLVGNSIKCNGGTTSLGNKAIIEARWFDSLEIIDNTFENVDSDAYLIDAGNYGSLRVKVRGNSIPSNCLGFPGSLWKYVTEDFDSFFGLNYGKLFLKKRKGKYIFRWYFTDLPSANGEIIGTGDGSTTTFSTALSYTPIGPGTVKVHYTIGGTTYSVTDDGTGNISDDNVTGTINYDTGDVNLTFTTAPDTETNITVDYGIVYTLFNSYISNGVHLYEVNAIASQPGLYTAYKAIISQNYNTVPTVNTLVDISSGVSFSYSLLDQVKTKAEAIIKGITNITIELIYYYPNDPIPNITIYNV